MHRNVLWIMVTVGVLLLGLAQAKPALAGNWTMPPATSTSKSFRPTNRGRQTPTALRGHIACPQNVREGVKQSTLSSGWTAARGGKLLQLAGTKVIPGREGELVCNYKETGPGARYSIILFASRPIPHGLSCKAVGNGFYCR